MRTPSRFFSRLLLCLGLLVLPLAFAGPASAATATQDIPLVNFPVFDPCSSETVLINGNLHFISEVYPDHINLHTTAQGITGIGPVSGAVYQYTQDSQDDFNTTGATEYSLKMNQDLVRHRTDFPDDDYFLYIEDHVTINANGDILTGPPTFSLECR